MIEDAETKEASESTRKINYYLLTIILLAFFGLLSTVLIAIFREGKDNAIVYAAIAGFVGPPTAALLAYMIRDTHVLVNGEMTAFRKELRAASLGRIIEARATGLVEGAKVGAKEADARTDALAEQKRHD